MQLKRQDGFTLAELVIALGIFSLVLVIMTAAVLQLFRIYDSGNQIRDTQEAARTIAQDISNDTHDSLAVAVGGVSGQSSICLYKTLQQQGGAQTLAGTEYYLAPHDTGSGTYPTVHQAPVSTTYNPPALPGCPIPASAPSGDVAITSSVVTVKKLDASSLPAANPRLLSVRMSVESAYAQQAGVDFQLDPTTGLDQCLGGNGSQYCSITNLEFSALSHSELNL